MELERDRLSHEITKVGFKNSRFSVSKAVSKPADRSFVDRCLVIMLMLICQVAQNSALCI